MSIRQDLKKLSLFPVTAEINRKGHLAVGGCDTLELAQEYGTPLYVFDEAGLRGKCAEFKTEFSLRYPDTLVIYASKAFSSKAMIRIVQQKGLGLDVVSGGEIYITRSADFPMGRVYFHGNNKSADEIELGLTAGVGRFVVDNFNELAMLDRMAGERGVKQDILLRLAPGVDPHTHKYNTTGTVDSKFGFTKTTWEEAVRAALSAQNVSLIGLHMHLGSGIFETEPYRQAIEIILDFAAAMARKHGLRLQEFDLGGGYAVQYEVNTPAPTIAAYAEVIASTIVLGCRELKLPLPRLIIEPGRAIVARSCIALYTVGTVKEIPAVRTYVCVDGGMGDNIRYALYGAVHEALVANRPYDIEDRKVTVAGKYCESGDILIPDIDLPAVSPGDILAVADCGAYCIPMQSNYNAVLRPAVIMVRNGKAQLVRRRETFEDLTRCEA